MLNEFMQIIGYIASCFTIVSAIGFIISKAKKQKRISWKEVKKGIKDLVPKVEKINPDIIITFSGRGEIVASLITTELDNKYPVYMCLLKRRYNDLFLNPQNWGHFNTTKWIIYVPDEVMEFKDKRVLIIDDVTNSGETIECLTEYLENKLQINKEKIFSLSLIANKDVLLRLHIPQEYWRALNNSEYTLPWGTTEIK